MGKVFGALVRLVVTLALLCLLGYNTWEINQLRAEVDELQRAAHAGTGAGAKASAAHGLVPPPAAGPSAVGTDGADVPALLQSARRHAEAARVHMERKEYAEASRELALSAQTAQRASAAAGAAGEDRFAALKRTLGAVQEKADSLLKEQGGSSGAGR